MASPSDYVWLTTQPNPKINLSSAQYQYYAGGWKQHAVLGNDNMTFKDLENQPAICGLKPKHGWGMDLFVEDECKRCQKKMAEL